MELANHNQEILNPAASIAELFSPPHLLGSSLPLIATFCQFHLLNGSPISGLLTIGHGPCLAQGLRVSGLVSLNNFPPGPLLQARPSAQRGTLQLTHRS